MSEDQGQETRYRKTSQSEEVFILETPRNSLSDPSQLEIEKTPTPGDRKESKSLDNDEKKIHLAKTMMASEDRLLKLMGANFAESTLGTEKKVKPPSPAPNPQPSSTGSGFLTRFLPAFVLLGSFGALNLILFSMLPMLAAIAPAIIGSISAAVLYTNSKSKLGFGLFLGGLTLTTLGLPFFPFFNPESLVLLQIFALAATTVGLIGTALGSYHLYKNEPTTLQFDDSPNYADPEIVLQEKQYLVEEIENAVKLSLENGAQHVLSLNYDAAAVAFNRMEVNGKKDSVEKLLAVMFRIQPIAAQAIFSKLQAYKAFATKDLLTFQADLLTKLSLKDATQELAKICQAAPDENNIIKPLFQKLRDHPKNLDKILLVLWNPRAAGSLTLNDGQFAHFLNTLVSLSSENPYLRIQLIHFSDTLKETVHIQQLKKFLCNEKHREGVSQLLVSLGTSRAADLMHLVLNDYSDDIDRTGNIQKNSVTQLLNGLSRQGHSLEAARLLIRLKERDPAWAQKYVNDLTNPENLPAKILDIQIVHFHKELVDTVNDENIGRVAALLKALVPAEPILVVANKEYKTILAKEWSSYALTLDAKRSAPMDEKKETVTETPEQRIGLLQEAVIAAAIAESKAKRKYIDSNDLRETLKFLTLKVLTLFDAQKLQSLPSAQIETFGKHLYTIMSASTLDHEDPKKTLHHTLGKIPFQSCIYLFGYLKPEFSHDARCLTSTLLAFTQFPIQQTRTASVKFLQYLKLYQNQSSLREAFKNLATHHADQIGKFLSDVLWYTHEDPNRSSLVTTLNNLVEHDHAYVAATLVANIYKHRPRYGHELIKSLFDLPDNTKRSEFLCNLVQFYPQYAVEMMRPLLGEPPSAFLVSDLKSLLNTHPGLIVKLCIHHPDIAEKTKLNSNLIAKHLDGLIATHISESNDVMCELIRTNPSQLKVILSTLVKRQDPEISVSDVKSTALSSGAPILEVKEKKISTNLNAPLSGGLGITLDPETAKEIKKTPALDPSSSSANDPVGTLLAYSVKHQYFYEAAMVFKLLFEDRPSYSEHKKILYTLCKTLSDNELHNFVAALETENAHKKLMEVLTLDLVLAQVFIAKLEAANTQKVEVQPFKALLGGDLNTTTLLGRVSLTAFQGRRNIDRFLSRATNQECVNFIGHYDGNIGDLFQRWARNHSEKASDIIQLFLQQTPPPRCATFINELEPSFCARIQLNEMLNKIESAKRNAIVEGLNPVICERAQLTKLLLTPNNQFLAERGDNSPLLGDHPGSSGYEKKESLSVILDMDVDPRSDFLTDQRMPLLASIVKAAAARNITTLKTGDLLRLTSEFFKIVDPTTLPGADEDIPVGQPNDQSLTTSLILEERDEAKDYTSDSQNQPIHITNERPDLKVKKKEDDNEEISKISTQQQLMGGAKDSISEETFSQHLLEAILAYASLRTTKGWKEALPDILERMPPASRIFLFDYLKTEYQENPKCLAAFFLGLAQNSSEKSIQDFRQEYLTSSYRNLFCDAFTELAKNKVHADQIGRFLSQLPDDKKSASDPWQNHPTISAVHTAIMDMVTENRNQEAATLVVSIYTHKPQLGCTIAASLLPQEIEQGYSGLSDVDSQPIKPDNRDFFLALKDHPKGLAIIDILVNHPKVKSTGKYFLKNLSAPIDNEKKVKPVFEEKERTTITRTKAFREKEVDKKEQLKDSKVKFNPTSTQTKLLTIPGVGFHYSTSTQAQPPVDEFRSTNNIPP